MQSAGCRAQGAGRRAQGAGCRAQGAGCRAQGGPLVLFALACSRHSAQNLHGAKEACRDSSSRRWYPCDGATLVIACSGRRARDFPPRSGVWQKQCPGARTVLHTRWQSWMRAHLTRPNHLGLTTQSGMAHPHCRHRHLLPVDLQSSTAAPPPVHLGLTTQSGMAHAHCRHCHLPPVDLQSSTASPPSVSFEA